MFFVFFCSYLRVLDLDYNKRLKGTFPNDIGQLSYLSHLALNEVLMSSTIPKSFGNLTQLVFS